MADSIKESAQITKKRNKSQDLNDKNAQESLQDKSLKDKIEDESKGSSRDVLVEELSDLAERVEQFEDFKLQDNEDLNNPTQTQVQEIKNEQTKQLMVQNKQ